MIAGTCRKADLDNLCAAVINSMRGFYKDPRNAERFEEWKERKHKEEKQKHDRN